MAFRERLCRPRLLLDFLRARAFAEAASIFRFVSAVRSTLFAFSLPFSGSEIWICTVLGVSASSAGAGFASAGASSTFTDEIRARFPGRSSGFGVDGRAVVALAAESRYAAVDCHLPARLPIRDVRARG